MVRQGRRTKEKICHSEDGCAVRGNLPVGYRLYIGAYVAVKLYREIATGLPALAMTTPLVRRSCRGGHRPPALPPSF